jgi:hypothetical protein
MATTKKATKPTNKAPALAATAVEAPAEQPVVIGYKGFDKDMKCRGFQYEIGKTHTHDGPVKHCKSGFHACENPLNVFDYYAPGTSRFAVVELSGDISLETGGDTKIASASITVKAEIGVPVIVSKAIEWITALCNPANAEHATGDWSASSATGYQSASSATGYQSASSATGLGAVALNTGLFGKARAAEGGAICLCSHDDDGNLLHIRASKVGENGIKPDVFYTLDLAGEFVEVQS